jgi:hypothetical protein
MDQSSGGGLEIGGGPGLKQAALVLGAVFVGVLAIVVAKEMSAEAMAVVVGVICGVAAAIPTSLLLLVVLTRSERRRYDREDHQKSQGQYPPVVVIQGGSPQGLPPGHAGDYWPRPEPWPPAQAPMDSRQWHVVGGEELLDE